MIHETNENELIDEIERISVTHEKAKEYLTKIGSYLDQQIDSWQHRQRTILDKSNQIRFPSSFDISVAKTERIGELTLRVTESLSRVSILMEQIMRIDFKSFTPAPPLLTSISTRIPKLNESPSSYHHETDLPYKPKEDLSTGRLVGQRPLQKYPYRPQPTQLSSDFSTFTNQNNPIYPSVAQQRTSFENSTRLPSSIATQNTQYNNNDTPYRANHVSSPVGIRRPQFDSSRSTSTVFSDDQMYSNSFNRQQIQGKEKIPFQNIEPSTKWKEAKVEYIESLSRFYVINTDQKVYQKFLLMQNELVDSYCELEEKNRLKPLENPVVGDFGVAKFSVDNIWYRARLINFSNNDEMDIIYVDYGNNETKSANEFFPLYKQFTEIPMQAIGCTLSEAFPKSDGNSTTWPHETIERFSHAVENKPVEIQFSQTDETEKWPLHFVKIIVDNQSVTNLLSLKQYIELRPNSFIAQELSLTITEKDEIFSNAFLTNNENFQ